MTQSRVDDYHEQAETLVTLYEYDGRNLVTKVVRSSGSQELYTYDGNGNMLTKTDGDGYVTEYSYNSLDLVSHINYNGAKEVSYQYNAVGELVRMDDWLGTTTFEVDLLGQLKKVTDHKGQVVSYTYDAVGNQTSVTYPDSTTVTRTYDEVYNLTNVKDAENESYTYTYDNAGRVTKLVYPNGWVEEYTYDSEGNLLKTVDTDPFHNNKKSTKYEYAYDAEGNLISEYKRETTVGNRAMTTTYTYDALNRIISAHEVAVSLDTTRTYQYDTLGNLIRQEQDGCEEYKYNGFSLDESKECGVLPGIIGTCRWEYTYDGRGNLVSEDKYTRTTTGMDWENVATYKYDETNRMVEGKNEQGEYSLYTYNGLGVRVARELIMQDNTHGYTDFHSETPSVENGLTRPEVVKESYVIDYTSPTFTPLTMDEVGGFNYRYVYGLDRLSVKITSEGTNWWGQHTTNNILKDYYHQDRMGSTTNMTDTYGRVVGRADYNEWGQITYREALDITSSYRRIYPQLNYTGHDWDDVLGMYYAKARFYSADDKRFVAMDPIKGNIAEPLSLVSYLYCVDNPLRWVDPLGLVAIEKTAKITAIDGAVGAAGAVASWFIYDYFTSELLPNIQAAFKKMMDDLADVAHDFFIGEAISYPTCRDVLTPESHLQQLFDTYLDDAGSIEIRTEREAQLNSMMQALELQIISFNLAASNQELQAFFEPYCCKIREAVKEATDDPKSELWCIYILVEEDGQFSSLFYVGMTNNAHRRYGEHKLTKEKDHPKFKMGIVEDNIPDPLTARVKEQLYMGAVYQLLKENIINNVINKRRSISSTRLNDQKSKEHEAMLQIFADWAEDLVLSALDEVAFPY